MIYSTRWQLAEFAALRKLSAHFDAIVYRMMRERRAESAPCNDLLFALLRVCDEETGNTALTDEEVRDGGYLAK